jgi:hypothetical protein
MKKASTPRPACRVLGCLTSLALFIPSASAAVSLTPTPIEPDCVVMSGVWGSGVFPYTSPSSQVERYDFYSEPFKVNFSFEVDRLSETSFVFRFLYNGGGLELLIYGDAWIADATGTIGSARGGRVPYVGSANEYSFEITAVYSPQRTGEWTGSYKVFITDCDSSPVPDSGGTLALFACGLGAVGGVRRVLTKRRS